MTDQAITIQSAEKARTLTALIAEITINSPQSLAKGQDYLVDVDKSLKDIQADEKALKRPYQDMLDKIRDAAKPWISLLTEKKQELNQKILAYKEAVRIEAAKQQAKELEKWEKTAAKKEAKAIANNQPVPILAPPPVIVGPAKTMETSSGAKVIETKRKSWRLPTVVVDGMAVPLDKDALTYEEALRYNLKIPASYFVLDAGAIGRQVRSGAKVEGVEIYDEVSTTVRR